MCDKARALRESTPEQIRELKNLVESSNKEKNSQNLVVLDEGYKLSPAIREY